jgi:hypothetical protein
MRTLPILGAELVAASTGPVTYHSDAMYYKMYASLVDIPASASSGAPSASLPCGGSQMVRSARGAWPGSFGVTSALSASSAAALAWDAHWLFV